MPSAPGTRTTWRKSFRVFDARIDVSLRTRRGSLSLLAIAVALLVFGFLPLGLVLRSALSRAAEPVRAELSDPAGLGALANTLVLSGAVTLLAVPLGTALAWLVERTDLFRTERGRRITVALLTVPIAIPPYLLAIAWAILGNGRNGLLNRAGAWIDLYGLDGAIMVLTTSSYPFSFLAVRAMLARANPALEEAARVSGAAPGRVLRDVTLPLAAPAIAGSAGLVFVFTASAFAVPYLFGSAVDPPIWFLTTRIYQYTLLGGTEMLQRAAACCVVLLAVSAAAQLLASLAFRGRSVVQVSGKAARPALLSLGRARTLLRALAAGFTAIFILLPIVTIAWTSFQRTFADPFDLTTERWVQVLERNETLRAFLDSVVLAAAAGLLVAALGTMIARARGKWGRSLAAAASTPYAVPGTVLAIGLILAFSREIRLLVADRLTLALYLPGTLGILLAAYVVKYLAFGVRGARAALDQLHPSLEEAARVSGASPRRAFRDVVLPLIAPGVAAAFVLVALTTLSELTMSVLLFGAGTETLGTLLFELQSYADPPAAAVVATAIVVFVLSGDFLVRHLERSKQS